ncbi:Gp49 family protein [Avibacterium volantium]|uniref:Gp49 family protein n=1 Tax=Avibacterium TaxID=292486 RepID=UPI0039FCDB35
MNKLTKDYLDSLVANAQYVHQDLLTICTVTVKNGFKLVGTSACADEQHYDAKIGEQVAYQNAFAKLWELEGYLLKQRLHEQSQGFVTLRNGNQAQIVYTSPFGKLLVVEQTDDELPKVHWHNADGSYHKDEQNQVVPHELDIIWEAEM